MAEKKHQKTAVVLKKFFGIKEGERLFDFAKELKSLTDEDRQQLTLGIEDESYSY